MPHRDQEIAMLRRELEMLMGERQSLLRVVGASAVLIASLDSKRLPVGAIEAADQVAKVDNTPVFQHLRPGDPVSCTSNQCQSGGGKQLTTEDDAQDQTECEANAARQLATAGRNDSDIEDEGDGDKGASGDGQHKGFGGRLGGLAVGDIFSNGGNRLGLQTIKWRFSFHVMGIQVVILLS